jgi:hypothetical protein
LTPNISSSITNTEIDDSVSNKNNSIYGQKRKRDDNINRESIFFNQKRKRGEYYITEETSNSDDKGKCENDTTQEKNTPAFKKGHFDNKQFLNTRKEASKVLKLLLESLDQELKRDVKDVYYIIENRDKVGIPLVSLKVINNLLVDIIFFILFKYSYDCCIIILEISEIIGRKFITLHKYFRD